MARLDPKSREATRRRAQKRLEGLDFTPQAAKQLSEVLIMLSECSSQHQLAVLSEFDRTTCQKPTWEVAGRRP